MTTAGRTTPTTLVGVFFMSAACMLYELCLTRVLSVLFYYHTAFLALSIAMSGLAAGGLLLRSVAPERQRGLLSRGWVCGVTMLFLLPAIPLIQLDVADLEDIFGGRLLAALGLTACVTVLPFVAWGAVFTALLERHRKDGGRLWGADLGGAALGAWGLVPLMDITGGLGTLLVCALIATPAAPLVGAHRLSSWGAALIVVAVSAVQFIASPFTIEVDAGTIDGSRRVLPEFERWNAFSRVAVLDDMGWDRGISEERYAEIGDQLPKQKEALIDIDAYAPMVEFRGDLEEARYLADSVSNLALHLAPRGAHVGIIGPGGGKDVVAALLFEPSRVTGFEINGILVDELVKGRYRDFTGDIYRHPKVEIVVGDARTALEKGGASVDVMIANSVATWAAQGGGAMSLTEQSVFTERAFSLIRGRLREGGVFSVSLMDEPGHALPLRVIETWRAQLDEEGRRRLADSVAVVANPWPWGRSFTSVILSKAPLDSEQKSRLTQLVDELGFELLYLEGEPTVNLFDDYFGDPDAFVSNYRLDVRSATDDRPFFFYTLRWSDALGFRGRLARSDNVAFLSVLLTFGVVVALAFLVFVGLRLAERGAGRGGVLPGRASWIFGLFGCGYIMIEMALIRRMTLLLGHPVYAVTVCLAGMLMWSGLGALLSSRWQQWFRRPLPAAIGCGLVALAVTWLFLPDAPRGVWLVASGGLRNALAFGALAPVGLFLGMPMPLGLRELCSEDGGQVTAAWTWNAIAAVVATVGATLLAVNGGFTAVAWTGAAAYLATLVLLSTGVFLQRRSGAHEGAMNSSFQSSGPDRDG